VRLHCIPHPTETAPRDFELRLAERVENLFDYFNEEHSEETALGLTSCTLQLMAISVHERGVPPC
jgi:hypothetical protein